MLWYFAGILMFPLSTFAESGYVGDEFTLDRPSVPYYATRIKSVMWSGQYASGISSYETSSGLRVRITSFFENSISISCQIEYEWVSGDRTLTSHVFKSYSVSCKAVEINVSNENMTMKVGQTQAISYSLSPSRGASLNFKSSDTGVATVSYGEVTAVGAGYACITISQDMGYDAYCYVTVTEPVIATSIELPAEATVTCYSSTVLSPTLTPSNANPTLKWKSEDTSIASVDQSGKVTGNNPGTTTVTVTTDNGLSASCDVTVKDVDRTPWLFDITDEYSQKSLYEGETWKVPYSVLPSYASYTLSWTSSDERVASVANGTVTAMRPGTARITGSIDGSYLTDYCDVTVKATPNVVTIWTGNGQRSDISLRDHVCLSFAGDSVYVKSDSTFTVYGSIEVKKFTLENVAILLNGDVNGDGTVDVADIATVISVMAGDTVPDASSSGRADVNGDGTVDVADIATIIDIMAGN